MASSLAGSVEASSSGHLNKRIINPSVTPVIPRAFEQRRGLERRNWSGGDDNCVQARNEGGGDRYEVHALLDEHYRTLQDAGIVSHSSPSSQGRHELRKSYSTFPSNFFQG